jgi:hypothetical protein
VELIGANPRRIEAPQGVGFHTTAAAGGSAGVVKTRTPASHKIVQDVHIFYVYSDAKASATFQSVAQSLIYELMVTGVLPSKFRGMGIEVFRDAKLLIGCDFDDLPNGLKCATQALPLSSAPETIADFFDGCAAQYAGLNGMFAKQQICAKLNATAAFRDAAAGTVHQPLRSDDVLYHDQHEHVLVKAKTVEISFTCDVCNHCYARATTRYHCANNCDWDVCTACMATAIAAAAAAAPVARVSSASSSSSSSSLSAGASGIGWGDAATGSAAAAPARASSDASTASGASASLGTSFRHHQHRHPLVQCLDDDGRFFSCDVCGDRDLTLSSQRYRCSDCDWDCCGNCHKQSSNGDYLPDLAEQFSMSSMNCPDARPNKPQRSPLQQSLRRCDEGTFNCSFCGWLSIDASVTPVFRHHDGSWVGCIVCAMEPGVALREFYNRHCLRRSFSIATVIERVGDSRMLLGRALQHMSKQRGLRACPGFRRAAKHGKAKPDGFGKKPKNVIMGSASSGGIPVATDTHGLVRYLARNMYSPTAPLPTSPEYNMWTHDTVTNIFLPESVLAALAEPAERGFTGSKLMHYYNSRPSGNVLTVRHSWCYCHACTGSPSLQSGRCYWKHIVGGAHDKYLRRRAAAVNAHAAGGGAEPRRVPASNADVDYAALCQPGQVVLVLVHPEDELAGIEEYFVGRVASAAWQHSHGNVEGQPFEPNAWLTRITWFKREREDATRGFLYKILRGSDHVTTVGGLLRVHFHYKHVTMSWDAGQGWWLSHALHTRILENASFEDENV